MPPAKDRSEVAVIDAVNAGRLSAEVLDSVVRRVLRLVEQSAPVRAAASPNAEYDVHHALARRAAAQCAVLLRNEGNVLPVQFDDGQTLVVIGPFASEPRYQGAGSSQVNPTSLDIPLDELRAALGDRVNIVHTPGFGLEDGSNDGALLVQACEAAADADTVVLFLGLPASAESEGFDRSDIDLPPVQLELVQQVAEVSERVVVVLANGSVVRTSTWEDSQRHPRVLARRPGRRWRGRRSVDRCSQPVRQARREHPGASGGQPVVPELPRRLPDRAIATTDSAWARSAMSVGTAKAVPPAWAISSTRASRRSLRRANRRH